MKQSLIWTVLLLLLPNVFWNLQSNLRWKVTDQQLLYPLNMRKGKLCRKQENPRYLETRWVGARHEDKAGGANRCWTTVTGVACGWTDKGTGHGVCVCWWGGCPSRVPWAWALFLGTLPTSPGLPPSCPVPRGSVFPFLLPDTIEFQPDYLRTGSNLFVALQWT